MSAYGIEVVTGREVISLGTSETEVTLLEIGLRGARGPQGVAGNGTEVYLQQEQPTSPNPYIWWKLDANGELETIWVNS